MSSIAVPTSTITVLGGDCLMSYCSIVINLFGICQPKLLHIILKRNIICVIPLFRRLGCVFSGGRFSGDVVARWRYVFYKPGGVWILLFKFWAAGLCVEGYILFHRGARK